jgi:L-lactate dehydrogenase
MKVAIIGSGRVGSATAFALLLRNLAREIILVGRDLEKAQGEAADLHHAAALLGGTRTHAGTIDEVVDCDIVILAVSAPEAPNSSQRLTHLGPNADICRQIIPTIARRSPHAILIVLTNPVDAITYLCIRLSGFPPSRVIGTGTLIDTGRFRSILSNAWKINALDVRAYILGEHGDSQFPALSVASAGGVKFDEHDAFVVEAATEARRAGHEVFKRKGYTNFAIASAAMMLVEAIETDSLSVMPVSTLVDGYLGVRDVCLSVPCIIGRQGVMRMLPVDLDADEAAAFRASARVLRQALDGVDLPEPAMSQEITKP